FLGRVPCVSVPWGLVESEAHRDFLPALKDPSPNRYIRSFQNTSAWASACIHAQSTHNDMHMPSQNLDVKDSDLELFGKLKRQLGQKGKSLSEFFANTPRTFFESNDKTRKSKRQVQV